MSDPPTTAERELERFHKIVEVAGEPIYTLNAEGRFTYVNAALIDATGYSRTELLGADVSLLLSEADIACCIDAIESLFETGDRSRTVDIDVETADGTRREAESTIALLPVDEGFSGPVGVARAID